jgi:hypothetical protein
MTSFPFRIAAVCGVVLLVGLIGCGSSSSAPVGTASDAGAPVDASSDQDSGVSVEDAGSDATPDAATDGDADSGACGVLQRCTSPSTPAIPAEISGTLDESCAASSAGADLQTRCTGFCKAANPGFATQTTCVAAATTFQCRCVNP